MAKKSKRSRRRVAGYTIGKSRIRRRKLNPGGRAFSMRGFMRNTLMPSTVGAAGALGIDLVLGFLPLPLAMKTGPMKTVIKIAGAAAIGAVAANFVKRDTAQQIAAGAITVALYDLIKGYTLPMLPPAVQQSIVSMGENDVLMEEYPSLEYAGAGYTAGGDADPMGEYVADDSDAGVGMYFNE